MLSVYFAHDAGRSLQLALTWNHAEVGEGLLRAGAEALPGCAVHSVIAAPAAQGKAVLKKGGQFTVHMCANTQEGEAMYGSEQAQHSNR